MDISTEILSVIDRGIDLFVVIVFVWQYWDLLRRVRKLEGKATKSISKGRIVFNPGTEDTREVPIVPLPGEDFLDALGRVFDELIDEFSEDDSSEINPSQTPQRMPEQDMAAEMDSVVTRFDDTDGEQ